MATVTKDILLPGDWLTPVGWQSYTPERIKHFHDRAKAMLGAGLQIPVCWNHQDDAVPLSADEELARKSKHSFSKLKDVFLKDGGLGATFEVNDPKDLEQLQKVEFCSPEHRRNVTAGNRVWDGESITHLAATPRPVQWTQGKFQTALSLDGSVVRLSLEGHRPDFDSLPEDAKRVAFAKMEKHDGSVAARKASDMAEQKKTKGAHRAAHKAHTAAAAFHHDQAEHHESMGNDIEQEQHEAAAAHHDKMAKYHLRKAGGKVRLAADAPPDDEEAEQEGDVPNNAPAPDAAQVPEPPTPAPDPAEEAAKQAKLKALLAELAHPAHGLMLPPDTTNDNFHDRLHTAAMTKRGLMENMKAKAQPAPGQTPQEGQPGATQPQGAYGQQQGNEVTLPVAMSLDEANGRLGASEKRRLELERQILDRDLADLRKAGVPPVVMEKLEADAKTVQLSLDDTGKPLASDVHTRIAAYKDLIANGAIRLGQEIEGREVPLPETERERERAKALREEAREAARRHSRSDA